MTGLTAEEIADAGLRLCQAEQTRQQIGLLSLEFPRATITDAYAVQAEFVRLQCRSGRHPVGWKIGLTSRAMQSALSIDTPDSGLLLNDMAFPNGAIIPRGRFIQPRVEAEIAFVMKSSLTGAVTPDDVLQATEYVVPSLEILDTRIVRADPASGSTRTIFDTIADNAANAGFVLGGTQIHPTTADLRWLGAIVFRNGQVEETGLGAGVLNNPATGVAWLAKRLADYGHGIEAGDVVLSGSFIRPLETHNGDSFVADFGRLGTISIHFE